MAPSRRRAGSRGLAAPLAEYAAATKSATVAFTRSLARALRDRHIRVNAVDGDVDEIAPIYVTLAVRDAAFTTGQVLHPGAERRSR